MTIQIYTYIYIYISLKLNTYILYILYILYTIFIDILYKLLFDHLPGFITALILKYSLLPLIL